MHQVLSRYIERKEMPGLVALVSHHDTVHLEALGTLSLGQSAPMQSDTVSDSISGHARHRGCSDDPNRGMPAASGRID